ncbi:MAG: hypothetical protein WCT10_04575 [Patescibacteria group bacterium]
MAKTCILCGYSPARALKPAGEPEDCPKCHAKDSVQQNEESDEE